MSRYIKTRQNNKNYVLLYIILIFHLLIINKFFYLIELPSFIAPPGNQRLAALSSFIITMIALFIYNKKSYLFSKYIISLFAFLLVEFIVSVSKYINQSILDTIGLAVPFFCILIYFVYSNYFESEVNYQLFINMIGLISVIYILLLLIYAYCHNHSLNTSLKIYGLSYGNLTINYRSDRVRIYAVLAGFVDISIIISAAWLLEQKNKKLLFLLIHLLNVTLGILGLYYISQSRVALLISITSISIMLLFSPVKNKIKKYIIIILIGTILFIALRNLISGTVYSLIATLSDANDVSNSARVNAIYYYWQQALENPFFGIGFASEKYYGSIIRGINFGYYDVGIIGWTGYLGFFITIWYVLLLYKIFKCIKTDAGISVMNLGIFLLFSLSAATLMVLDQERINALPIGLAIIGYNCRQSNAKEASPIPGPAKIKKRGVKR